MIPTRTSSLPLRQRVLALGLRALTCIVSALSLASTRCLGRWLGAFLFSFVRARRKVTLGNLQAALDLPPAAAQRLGREVYAHLATGALEFLQIPALTPRRARAVLGESGLAQLERLLSGGHGLLVLTAHLGNWDLLACAAALCGLKVNVVTRTIKASWLNQFWMAQRAACGVKLWPASGSSLAILAALRRNEIVALVLDQHEPRGSILPFFRRPAATGTSLARLARATGTKVVPAFLLRAPGGYRLEVQDPLPLTKTDDRRQDILRNTLTYLQVIEAAVRRNPEQWLWLHRRWKVPSGAPAPFSVSAF